MALPSAPPEPPPPPPEGFDSPQPITRIIAKKNEYFTTASLLTRPAHRARGQGPEISLCTVVLPFALGRPTAVARYDHVVIGSDPVAGRAACGFDRRGHLDAHDRNP